MNSFRSLPSIPPAPRGARPAAAELGETEQRAIWRRAVARYARRIQAARLELDMREALALLELGERPEFAHLERSADGILDGGPAFERALRSALLEGGGRPCGECYALGCDGAEQCAQTMLVRDVPR